MTDTPNSDARPPGNAWVARNFERRDDVGPCPSPGAADSACLSAGNSTPVAEPAKDDGGRVLFERVAGREHLRNLGDDAPVRGRTGR